MLSKEELIRRIEGARQAFLLARQALGDIDLDTLDTYDIEATLRDAHSTANVLYGDLGGLLDELKGVPAVDPDPFGGGPG